MTTRDAIQKLTMITENNLDADRWASISLMEQMANIGSEVGRSCKWLMKGKPDMAEKHSSAAWISLT